jgi:hypothetical protein
MRSLRRGSKLTEQPAGKSSRSAANSFPVSSLAAPLNLDAVLSPRVGLVELGSLSITERNPIANRVTVGQWGAGNASDPAVRD